MVNQTTMTNGRSTAPATAMTRSMSDLAADIATLAELQVRLFLLDAKESAKRLAVPAAMILGGGVLLLGTIPVLLLAIAALLVLAGLGVTASLFISFFLGAAFGTIPVVIAWSLLRSSPISFQRSREELAQNVRWIKDALKQNGRASQAAECR